MRCKYFEERQDLFSREDGAFAFRHVGPWTECIPSDVLIALGFPSSLYFSHFIQVHAGNSDLLNFCSAIAYKPVLLEQVAYLLLCDTFQFGGLLFVFFKICLFIGMTAMLNIHGPQFSRNRYGALNMGGQCTASWVRSGGAARVSACHRAPYY